MKVSWEKVAGAEKYLVYRNNTLLSTTTALYVLDRAVKLNSGKSTRTKLLRSTVMVNGVKYTGRQLITAYCPPVSKH